MSPEAILLLLAGVVCADTNVIVELDAKAVLRLCEMQQESCGTGNCPAELECWKLTSRS